MTLLADVIASGARAETHRPWPRTKVDAETWRTAVKNLAQGRWSLLGLWADESCVHMAALEKESREIGVVTIACEEGHFSSVAASHAPANRLERTIHDLFGHVADGATDTRPWLDHDRWGVRQPLGRRIAVDGGSTIYRFLPAEGEGLHQVPVGPVHAGIIEPGFFLFTANGEAVVRLEERLGYTHKGVEALMEGAAPDRAMRIAARTSGDSTVAYALSFALAAEAALIVETPPRAAFLRALMAELERIANHLGDFGAICNDASFAMLHAQCGILRELVLRASDAAFGHRLMRDCIVVGGVTTDLAPEGRIRLRSLLEEIEKRLPHLVELYDKTASLLDRTVATGILRRELVEQYACGGYVGRASGRCFDARKSVGYAPYLQLRFEVPVLSEGDVNARVWVRIREIEQSLGLIRQILDALPEGATRTEFDPATGESREGMALVEGFRGDVLTWLRFRPDGHVARCHLRDPSWFQWPLLEAAIEGNIVADFPLCNKSFNCSYSGHDL